MLKKRRSNGFQLKWQVRWCLVVAKTKASRNAPFARAKPWASIGRVDNQCKASLSQATSLAEENRELGFQGGCLLQSVFFSLCLHHLLSLLDFRAGIRHIVILTYYQSRHGGPCRLPVNVCTHWQTQLWGLRYPIHQVEEAGQAMHLTPSHGTGRSAS